MIFVYVTFSALASENHIGIFRNFSVTIKQTQNTLKHILFTLFR